MNQRAQLNHRRVFSFLLICTANAFADPSIQPLLESEVQSGCGCNFQYGPPGKSGKTFIQWLEGEKAYMRVDNQLELLRVEQTGGRSKKTGAISVGDTSVYALRNRQLTAVLSTQVVQACTPEYPECESVGLRAIVKVIAPNGTATIKATGSCGC